MDYAGFNGRKALEYPVRRLFGVDENRVFAQLVKGGAEGFPAMDMNVRA